jgi:hypothetical protein
MKTKRPMREIKMEKKCKYQWITFEYRRNEPPRFVSTSPNYSPSPNGELGCKADWNW